MKTLLVISHGIRTKATSTLWPMRLQMDMAMRGISYSVFSFFDHYYAGATPLTNHLYTNPRQARSLVSRVTDCLRDWPDSRLCFVGHSNGTNINTKAMLLLAEKGYATDSAVLIGSAVNSDVKKSGLLALHEDGMLNKATAYVSPDERVVKYLESIPLFYGSLGTRGFRLDGKSHGTFLEGDKGDSADFGFTTRTFRGYEHSAYFEDPNMQITFDCIYRDLGLHE